jgi:hypothetical protein
LASFALSALVVAELSSHGVDQESLRLVLRTTARTSAVLFTLGFATPFLPRLQGYSDSMLLCFSFSQALHLIAIVWLVMIRHTQTALVDPPGLLAYACVAVIVFGIFSEGSTRVGPRFRRLETIALYIFWTIVTGAFAGFFPGIKFSALHFLIVVLLVMALFVRLYGASLIARSMKSLEARAQP